MSFGWPLGLAALAALLVPIVIHLVRRRSGAPVLVGSLRHVPRAAAPRRARARLSEPWLLAVRLALLTLLALVLAEPRLRGGPGARAARIVLALPEGFDAGSISGSAAAAADSLRNAGADVVALPMNDLWSELAELDDGLPAGSTVHVVAPERLRVAGTRPELHSRVVLHRFDRAESHSAGADPSQGRVSRVGASEASASEAGAPESPSTRMHHVVIVADTGHRLAAARAAAAFRAVAEHRGDSLELAIEPGALPSSSAWLVHLAESPVPAAYRDSIHVGATVIAGCCDAPTSGVSAERIGAGLLLTAPAFGDPPLDASFPELVALLWPDPVRLSPADVPERRISTAQALPAFAGARAAATGSAIPVGRTVLLLAAGLFLLERWLSHRRTVKTP